ncbi:PTS sugar transporter subunit IIA [Clostridium chauvoei]|uniref:PTS EIIA type-2 domain-containing protein n=2 Tax=Clostridium chauvoei TaxID=46867 RepID=S6FJR7_9CLOT|nr:PTS sugar transporter subunit IIA [Clostridium chauvoei]ATD54297.1 PTS maltose transporter subunit IIBC [Clostridium chauvoei]ATD58020.1 PTS maltose transporter subunit IIBC [Clostridium chauvoei]MBX7279903.1 PTS sugar transporter subunit IIA [Clostridium chauvoei]MBX7282179.1 PTS sugar transporter subunit IIA [Clostridium chauvoei]MBX7284793.1 PTS sugar transporter subunit IIA [Clostridium chauvoei]
MLRELLNEDIIKLDVNAKTWQNAIYEVGDLLLKAGKVEEKYIKAMIDTVNEMGAYIVMANGVAMPHARPENGAKDIGFSLITLKNPIAFGNEEYDPVRVIIAICALDHNSHIELLKDIMLLLEDDDFIEKINNCKDKVEIINLLKSYI